MKKFFLVLPFSFLLFFAQAQKKDKKLQLEIEEAINGFNGDIGIYIKNLKMVKLFLLMQILFFLQQVL
jgi:beta-lactamase class A